MKEANMNVTLENDRKVTENVISQLTTENDRLMDKKETAEYFQRTPRWVELQVKNNGMPCIRLTKRTVRWTKRILRPWQESLTHC